MKVLATFAALTSLVVASAAQLAPHELLVASRDTDEVLRYDTSTGLFVDAFVPAGLGGLDGPHGLRFGPDGNLYVASAQSREILRFDGTNGAFLGVAMSFPNAGLYLPQTLAFGPDGQLYVGGIATGGGVAISKFDLAPGGVGTNLFVSIHFNARIEGLEFGPDGLLFVSTIGQGLIRVDPATGTYAGTAIPFELPPEEMPLGLTSVTFAPDGLLYAHLGGGQQVKRYDAETGAYVDRFIGPLHWSSASTIPAGGLTFDAQGDWYVALQSGANENRIGHYERVTGDLIEILDPANVGGLEGPAGMAFPPRVGTTYGCGVNPAGSLTALAGLPRLGTTFTLGVDDPTGTTTPLSPAIVFFAREAAPNFPCGVVLPGFGLGGPMGELLVDLASPNPLQLLLSSTSWTTPGVPVPIDVAVPNSTSLVGRDLFVQAALFDVSATSGQRLGLTEGMSVRVSF